jgi:hypothetical protein
MVPDVRIAFAALTLVAFNAGRATTNTATGAAGRQCGSGVHVIITGHASTAHVALSMPTAM